MKIDVLLELDFPNLVLFFIFYGIEYLLNTSFLYVIFLVFNTILQNTVLLLVFQSVVQFNFYGILKSHGIRTMLIYFFNKYLDCTKINNCTDTCI